MKKKNDFVNFIKKYKFILMTFIIILLFCIIIISNKNDGMTQKGIIDIYYRVYTKEKGWSRWSKNGMPVGDKDTKIKGLEVKTKKVSTPILYTYKNKIEKESKNNKNSIYGIRLIASYGLLKDHDLCYRTYNQKNKWLDWECNMEFSGNINEPATSIEIKIIPKNVAKQDYLKNYNMNKNSSIGFDEVR